MMGPVRRAVHLRTEHVAGRVGQDAYRAATAAIAQACDILRAVPRSAGWSQDLQTRFGGHRRGLLTFRHDPTVPPTNNASERSLRPTVAQRNVPAGFRAEAFGTGYAALRTVAATAQKRGHAVFAQLLAAAGTVLPITTGYTRAHPSPPEGEP